jgi:ABC-2 type transport system ATP-binding protein
MAETSLEARRLTKTFGTRTAVDGVTFTAEPREIVGLLGPNGAGKTTTIRLLTTVLTPTSGEFSVAGVPSSQPNEIRRRVGVLPESAGYPAHQTGREYLTYFARLFGMSRSESSRVATRLLEQMGLQDRASSPLSTYSRGMRQRLGIARAMVNDPDVVFLDEPTLGLDPAGQRQVLRKVRDIAADRGATVILSTHTLTEVEEVCNRVLILGEGRVLVSGTVAEITSAVAAPRFATLRVPGSEVGAARQVLAGLQGLTFAASGERPDVLRISRSGRDGMNPVLRALLAADVTVLSFEVEGTRLHDAYLALTGDATVEESSE